MTAKEILVWLRENKSINYKLVYAYYKTIGIFRIVYFIKNRTSIKLYKYIWNKKDPRAVVKNLIGNKLRILVNKLTLGKISYFPIMGMKQFGETIIAESEISDSIIKEGKEIINGSVKLENGKRILLSDLNKCSSVNKNETLAFSTFSSFSRILINAWLITKDKKYIVVLGNIINEWADHSYIGEFLKWQPTMTSVRLENLLYVFNAITKHKEELKDELIYKSITSLIDLKLQ